MNKEPVHPNFGLGAIQIITVLFSTHNQRKVDLADAIKTTWHSNSWSCIITNTAIKTSGISVWSGAPGRRRRRVVLLVTALG